MSKTIDIGTVQDGPLTLNVQSLLESKLLVQANSGGGKSNTVRVLYEELSKILPCVVVDPEGEFATLREKVDLVLVGPGGELDATPKNAGEVALKLLGLGVSAVIDLYGMVPADQRQYVARYCENLIAAPKRTWKPFVLFIDEAQMFCPEKADSVSRGPVIEVMTRSRKRGMCPILVTPRFAMLDADARGAINNMLIGRATLDIDYKRAGETLGMPHSERRGLANLKKGQFHAFGPSFGHDGVQLSQVRKAETRPAKIGTEIPKVPAPSAAIKAVVAELTALAVDKDPDDVHTIEQAQERIRALSKELRAAKSVKPAAPSLPTGRATELASVNKKLARLVEVLMKFVVRVQTEGFGSEDSEAILAAVADAMKKVDADVNKALASRDARVDALKKVAENLLYRVKEIQEDKTVELAVSVEKMPPHRVAAGPVVATKPPRAVGPVDASGLDKCQRLIVGVLAQYPEGCTVGKLALLSGYRYSGGFRNALSGLRTKGLMAGDNTGVLRLTAEGLETNEAREAPPLPLGKALLEYWKGHSGVDKCMRAIMDVLWANDGGVIGTEIGAMCEPQYEYSGGFRNALSALRTAGIISGGNTELIKLSWEFRQ